MLRTCFGKNVGVINFSSVKTRLAKETKNAKSVSEARNVVHRNVIMMCAKGDG